jgi:hypothetical protein
MLLKTRYPVEDNVSGTDLGVRYGPTSLLSNKSDYQAFQDGQSGTTKGTKHTKNTAQFTLSSFRVIRVFRGQFCPAQFMSVAILPAISRARQTTAVGPIQRSKKSYPVPTCVFGTGHLYSIRCFQIRVTTERFRTDNREPRKARSTRKGAAQFTLSSFRVIRVFRGQFCPAQFSSRSCSTCGRR